MCGSVSALHHTAPFVTMHLGPFDDVLFSRPCINHQAAEPSDSRETERRGHPDKKDVHSEHVKYRVSPVTSARGFQGPSLNSILTCTSSQAHKQKTYPLLEVVIGLVRYLRHHHQSS